VKSETLKPFLFTIHKVLAIHYSPFTGFQTMAEETVRQQISRRLGELKLERNSFIPHWRELTDFLAPRTGKYLVIDRNKGIKANDKIINSCATTALRTLKSGMHAGMTSPARPWFRLTADDADIMKSASVKNWLFDVENRMRVVFIRSNFYNVMPMIYGCAGGHGTAAMMILEDDDTAIRCYPFPIGSFMIALNDRLKCDTLYRELPMTIRQCVQQFGLDNVSQTIKSLWDRGSYETPVEITHAIEPNVNRDTGKLNAKDKPFRSVYFETGKSDDKLLRESGFDEFPVMAPRWDVEGDDVYGYSPGMDALGVVKGLQFCEKRKAEALDKLVRPPMLADASLRTQRSTILPGDVTYIDNLAAQQHAGFRPAYQFSPNIEEIRADIEAMKKEIQHIFFEDMMSMFAISDVSNITATEVDERHQEKLLVLGPVIERFGEELYDPAIYRTFAIMRRRGMIPPPPPELQGRPFKIEYISIMAQAQMLVGTASMERVAGYIGNLAQINPQAVDVLDVDAAGEEYATMHGVPPNIITSVDQRKAIRAQRAQQQQAQQMAAAGPSTLQAATAAKTLSQTNVSDTSALTRLLGVA